ncbi:serine hydrolase domain-containing protein [Saccharothrix variisporea]|uniref:CubicO group peptidase (Beta-lactamase class C family) n=1 Tax=Saccharothrix variisporea TaxID=543527 RepID=A0A495XGW1_9PSEU|nr:serine hydrolase domain-containing protein [Saccharothrix variisporea]RKT72325.1 CubicO group peptidase (beta-lactamase class C family) [Saccharothrix variisporea]
MEEHLTPLLTAAPGATGVAVAARRRHEDTVLLSGTTARAGAPLTPGTRFEIGSLTKTFTALLLAQMVAAGEVAHDDDVARYLPPGSLRIPITLAELATHTSGLPRLPPGLLRTALPKWFSNPYAAFGPDALLDALPRTRTRTRAATHAPTSPRYRYSNYGVAVLGLALARAAGVPYPDLLADRVLRPLGLHDTDCTDARQATGHWHGRPRPPWRIPGLPAAGALRSTAPDLLRYLTALLDPDATPLAAALVDVARPRLVRPGTTDDMCLVWNRRARPGRTLLFHAGATRGFTAFAGYSPESGTALVALANSAPGLRTPFVQRSYLALRTLATP